VAQDDVHARARRCVREHANATDWLLLMDTDEHLYAEHEGVSKGALSNVLSLLESDGAHGALVPWSMMYGEQLTLEAQVQQSGGLLRAFPRVLSVAQVCMPATCRTRPCTGPLPAAAVVLALTGDQTGRHAGSHALPTATPLQWVRAWRGPMPLAAGSRVS
jgi:hypothetical protein